MTDTRPNPDELLAQVKAEEAHAKRGSLKVFFGYAAGVGKTFAMLENAQRAKMLGVDVVVGYVEPHGRAETEALLAGLEAIPMLKRDYRGASLREFDVDAALARRPQLLLVDELAHTNAEGCRHKKRWQDVEELLAAGIDVWTTLNVQHIESLNDVIGQITGIVVRETIPDHVFDMANEIELIDLAPDELIHRLQAGKVYLPEQAQRAIQSFFQKANLTALRELSFRSAARRIHSEVESARRLKSVVQPWATTERILVCVGPSPTTARVIRTAKRMATALDAPWLAVSVDLSNRPASSQSAQRIADHFRLAEQLGAETITLAGSSIADTILAYARTRNVTNLLIGKTHQPRWRRLLFGTVVDDLLDKSGDIDVYVIHGEEEKSATTHQPAPAGKPSYRGYIVAIAITALVGALAYGLRSFQLADAEANTVMLFLAAVAWTAYRVGRQPAIMASILAVLTFDFFFVPPFFTFAVADAQYIVTFAVMLVIGLGIGTLTARLKDQIERTRLRERRTQTLYELGKQLSSINGRVFLVNAAGSKMVELIEGDVAIYLSQPNGSAKLVFGQQTTIAQHNVSLPTAQWVIDHHQMAGAGTNTLPNAIALFLPLIGSLRTHGAIGMRGPEAARLLDPDVRRLLEACANQLALALERDQLALAAADARVQAEAEQLRSSLLSSVSHDLKTPLAAIAGASSSLLESQSLDHGTQRQLLETIAEESQRLNRLLDNVLQMSKLEAGVAPPNKQWHVLEEIIGSALHHTRRELADHPVHVHIPDHFPLVLVDDLLFEQVLINLLENAARHTPAQTQVTIKAMVDGANIRIVVADRGPGIPPDSVNRLFEKFYRATPTADGSRGSGLGLAICKAIVQIHGGHISAANRAEGGAEFVIQLPHPINAPRIDVE